MIRYTASLRRIHLKNTPFVFCHCQLALPSFHLQPGAKPGRVIRGMSAAIGEGAMALKHGMPMTPWEFKFGRLKAEFPENVLFSNFSFRSFSSQVSSMKAILSNIHNEQSKPWWKSRRWIARAFDLSSIGPSPLYRSKYIRLIFVLLFPKNIGMFWENILMWFLHGLAQ